MYYFIVVIEYLRLYLLDPSLADRSNRRLELSWRSVLHLPYIQIFPRIGPKMGGHDLKEQLGKAR